MLSRIALVIFSLLPCAWAQNVPVQEVILDNGMKLLLVVRKGSPNVAAGWVAKVGSVNEHSGVTGISVRVLDTRVAKVDRPTLREF